MTNDTSQKGKVITKNDPAFKTRLQEEVRRVVEGMVKNNPSFQPDEGFIEKVTDFVRDYAKKGDPNKPDTKPINGIYVTPTVADGIVTGLNFGIPKGGREAAETTVTYEQEVAETAVTYKREVAKKTVTKWCGGNIQQGNSLLDKLEEGLEFLFESVVEVFGNQSSQPTVAEHLAKTLPTNTKTVSESKYVGVTPDGKIHPYIDCLADLQKILITNGHWYNQQKGEKPTEDDKKGMIKQIEGVNEIFNGKANTTSFQEKLRNDPSLPRILWELNGKIDRYNRNISDRPSPKSQSEVEKDLPNDKLPGLETKVQQFLQGYQHAVRIATANQGR